MEENKRVAVFIDAENISAEYADKIISEAANFGDVIIKRAFADWSSSVVKGWTNKVKELSLRTEQKFAAVKGKNASDISLIINAMTVLFEKRIDVFCLASSDSDFTELVQELREREKQVIGFGVKQTVQAFVNSFGEFIYLDNSNMEQEEKQTASSAKDNKNLKVASDIPQDRLNALKVIIEKLIEGVGKAFYSQIGTEMRNKFSDFIPKNYGCTGMKDFILNNIKAIGNYEIKVAIDNTTRYLVPKTK